MFKVAKVTLPRSAAQAPRSLARLSRQWARNRAGEIVDAAPISEVMNTNPAVGEILRAPAPSPKNVSRFATSHARPSWTNEARGG